MILLDFNYLITKYLAYLNSFNLTTGAIPFHEFVNRK